MESAAQIWRNAAIEAFNQKNFGKASECYYKAAKEYRLKYENANTDIEKEKYKEEYNFCVNRYQECKNPTVERPRKKSSIATSGSSSNGDLESMLEEEMRIDIPKKKPKYSFDDVGGMDELKKKFKTQIIDTFVEPTVYDELKKTNKQSYLLYGPPGTGKTYILEAMVGELNKELKKKGKKEAVFIPVKLSKITSKYVGDTEKVVTQIFEEASKNEPCVLFLDELDFLASKRDGKTAHYDKVVSSFLQDFEIVADKKVIIVGATNMYDRVDPAVMRPGRFGDNQIEVPLPDYEARKAIFKVRTKGIKKKGYLSKNVDFDKLAEETDGFSSAAIGIICDSRVLDITKDRSKKTGKNVHVSHEDFQKAIKDFKQYPELKPLDNLICEVQ